MGHNQLGVVVLKWRDNKREMFELFELVDSLLLQWIGLAHPSLLLLQVLH